LQEVAADDVTEEHKALLERTKRMLVATGADQNIPGAGPVRHSSAAAAGALLLWLVGMVVSVSASVT
jgi:hypothetical protein